MKYLPWQNFSMKERAERTRMGAISFFPSQKIDKQKDENGGMKV
jgi:hypothetical protein